ncbi:hypothetical protein QZH41_012660 [Actinostola sp. cb2023]|nr:hypothetical protein QZH41_012660 [Actinostola sp. cb2023]
MNHPSIIMSVFEYLTNRQLYNAKLSKTTISGLRNHHIPFLFKPSNISIGKTDKVFASKWLDERRVICGTKCNKLLVLDVLTKERMIIPMLQGSRHSIMPQASAGVHDISINQSRSLLATNGENPNHLAIYRLPTLDPVLIGEAHSDWVFGTEWISDRILATGQAARSRDGTISIWNTDCVRSSSVNSNVLGFSSKIRHALIPPKATMTSPLDEDKIRDLVYNSNSEHLAALSPNAFIYVWDVATSKRLSTIHLPFEYENVCLAMHKERDYMP